MEPTVPLMDFETLNVYRIDRAQAAKAIDQRDRRGESAQLELPEHFGGREAADEAELAVQGKQARDCS